MTKTAIIIPARYEAQRFPGKCLAKIDHQSVIQHVYRKASVVSNAQKVIVATDDERIKDEIQQVGGNVILTSGDHKNGTSRVAEVAGNLDHEYIINLQGDEPLINPRAVEKLIDRLHELGNGIVTLKKRISQEKEITNPNVVKVVTDQLDNALYFSRSPIPFVIHQFTSAKYFKHIGIYGFSKKELLRLITLPQSVLEKAEQLEQLRWLSHGYNIHVFETDYESIGVDTPADLEKIKSMFLS